MKQIDNSISVIVPTFNSARYINRTLQSVVNQDIIPEELIISDDGSTDNTIKNVNNFFYEFRDKISIQIIRNKHIGPGFARNQGILKATKKWISFLDSDDIWSKKKIKEVKKIINENGKCNFITHFEKYRQIDNKTIEISQALKSFLLQNKNLKQYLYEKNIFSTSAITLKKDLLKNNLFDENLMNAQDYELWLKIYPYINLKIIPKNLGTYVQTLNNITSKHYFFRIKSELVIANRYRHYVKLNIFLKKILKIIFSKQWLNI
tara:strand:- start:430 stop:1218 length:789 start_codon:yes stop_codon:yes gene_type:complete